jgi:hypothetical protein
MMRTALKFPLLAIPAVLLLALALASPAAAEIGLQQFSMAATNQNGTPDTQAGSHPYALTTTFRMDLAVSGGGLLNPADDLKDAIAELPPGFVGNPDAVPRCAYLAFIHKECPSESAVGVATTFIPVPAASFNEIQDTQQPVYNIEPSPGVTAELAFMAAGLVPALLNVSVRTGGDYGVTVRVNNISQAAAIYASKVTIWGVPADPSHDALRGSCVYEGVPNAFYNLSDPMGSGLLENEVEQEGPEHYTSLGTCHTGVPVQPLLTNPTSCGVPRTATLSIDSWQEPGRFVSKAATLPMLSGCEKLGFHPTIAVSPDGTAGSTPTGLSVDVHVAQESTTNPVGLGTADVKDTTVVLPAGVQLSPSAADGLEACSQAEVGLHDDEPVSCPNASKVANVRIKTPLLEEELQGAVYLAAPQNFAGALENPFGSLLALYLVAEDPVRGVLIKLAGKVSPNYETGQLTTTFEGTPQLPFEDLKLEFYGTDRAPLATPALCGTYATETSFTPWSSAEPANPAEIDHPSSSFQVASGPAGASCSDPLPFSPLLESGTTNINAGSFSDLTTTLSREDGQQAIQSVQLHYPPGLSGLLSGVKLCGEAEANAGTCGPESQIGETIVSIGLGNDPFTVTGGKVYLTEKYEGAPFGLSIVNPAKAGPFDLQEGRPVVVRAKIEIDPRTAALTVTTNSAQQGYAIPQIIEGIPLQIKHVSVNVTRPGFTFNPTNCNPTHITGTISSAEGASSPVAVPFQVTNCASLKFQPRFSVSTSGKTSKADGASLTARVTYPSVPQGAEADIGSVKVELPKQLPSRMTTLQKACTAAQFDANPAGCPAASVIGHAVVHTPLLPVPLEGPTYFVSNGGEAFPNLIMVLQGYGITIDLVGDTFISKAGITSTTFKAVPDQPVSSFELTLGEGPYSALTANANLCALTRTVLVKKKVTVKAKGRRRTVTRRVKQVLPEPLTMPNEFVAQNGAVIHQSTNIGVTGCPKAKGTAKKRKKPTSGGKRKKK